MVSLKLTVVVVVVFPLKWRFYPSNISAISLREREKYQPGNSTTVSKLLCLYSYFVDLYFYIGDV